MKPHRTHHWRDGKESLSGTVRRWGEGVRHREVAVLVWGKDDRQRGLNPLDQGMNASGGSIPLMLSMREGGDVWVKGTGFGPTNRGLEPLSARQQFQIRCRTAPICLPPAGQPDARKFFLIFLRGGRRRYFPVLPIGRANGVGLAVGTNFQQKSKANNIIASSRIRVMWLLSTRDSWNPWHSMNARHLCQTLTFRCGEEEQYWRSTIAAHR